MSEFWGFAGISLVILSVLGPLAYCTANMDNPTNSLQRACIDAKGDWRQDGWIGPPSCKFDRNPPEEPQS